MPEIQACVGGCSSEDLLDLSDLLPNLRLRSKASESTAIASPW